MKEKETINEFQWEKRFDGLNTVTIISLKNTVKGDYHTNPKPVKIWLIKYSYISNAVASLAVTEITKKKG